MATSNWAVGVDVELLTSKAKLQQQLDTAFKGITARIEVDTGDSSKKVKDLTDSGENLGLTFQEANLIMSKCMDTIASMVEQVYALNDSLTEFKKVSDLQGASLDNYVSKLTDMGTQVARTG